MDSSTVRKKIKPEGLTDSQWEAISALTLPEEIATPTYEDSRPSSVYLSATYRKNKRPFHPSPTALDRS